MTNERRSNQGDKRIEDGIWREIIHVSAMLSAVSITLLALVKSETIKVATQIIVGEEVIYISCEGVCFLLIICAILFLSNVYLGIDFYLDKENIQTKDRLKNPILDTFISGWFMLYVIVGICGGPIMLIISVLVGVSLLIKTITLSLR